ncbi:MAG: excinuclease ABC subunit UvrB [Candidatus Nealsonbacteria bacterium]
MRGMFKLVSKFKPTGDQPQAIKKLSYNLKIGVKDQVLLGVTGSGKTFTMAKAIERLKKPTLIISHNKTLAAQLYQEFKEFFPKNAVHYFVSYYDYYQPEAYIPQSDTYIEKDAKINEELDRLRHAATQDLLTRDDVIVIASVSCVYNIGSPEDYQKVSLEVKAGQEMERKSFLSYLTSMQYKRNDFEFKPGDFRVRGNVVDIFLITGQGILRAELKGNRIENLSISKDIVSPKYQPIKGKYRLFPGHFWVTPQDKINIAIENIKLELENRLKNLRKEKKVLEAQRLEQRTNYDIEMLKETGFCRGIENYSRHMEFREPGTPPFSLLDYYKKDFIIFIDESHMTIPQLRAMSNQDKARKKSLIDYGFRLPSAIDNRPLTFDEFNKKTPQVVYVSATPAEYEKDKAKKHIVEQLIRPTGLLEPSVEIKPVKDQVKDLIEEIKERVKKKERVLALTITKRLAEALSDYLSEQGIKTKWLHSEIKTLERPIILQELREGKYDVLVGINLLREGLDLPEVSLVAILDADKEGFLRSETTLIQTMGRTARHQKGKVILYADKMTNSMKMAIKEINRRRKIQSDYNKKHKITPKAIFKEIRKWPFAKKEEIASEFSEIRDKKLLEKEMKTAANNLDFERAAELRDLIKKIK